MQLKAAIDAKKKEGHRKEGAPRPDSAACPLTVDPIWSTKTDPESGRQYYVYTATGERTWRKPWITRTDTKTGKLYYVNTESGARTWDKPAAGEQALSSTGSDAGPSGSTTPQPRRPKLAQGAPTHKVIDHPRARPRLNPPSGPSA